MKTTTRTLLRGLAKPLAIAALSASSLVAAALPQSAAAETAKLGGSICQPYYGSQAGDFDYYPSGMRNRSSSPRWITCPIARPGASTTYIAVSLNMYNVAHATNAVCATYSYDGVGNYLAGHSDSSIPTGNATAYTSLSGSATSGFISAMCLLTPNSSLRSIYVYH